MFVIMGFLWSVLYNVVYSVRATAFYIHTCMHTLLCVLLMFAKVNMCSLSLMSHSGTIIIDRIEWILYLLCHRLDESTSDFTLSADFEEPPDYKQAEKFPVCSIFSLSPLSLLPTSPYCYPPYLINAHLSTLLPPPPCRLQPRDHFRKSSLYTLPFVASCKQPPSSETNASAMAANYQRKSHHLKVSPWHAENLPSSSMQARPLPAFFSVCNITLENCLGMRPYIQRTTT